MQTQTFTCPCCGFSGLTFQPYRRLVFAGLVRGMTPPYQRYFGEPSHRLCVSCGFEFGKDDEPATGKPARFEDHLEAWKQKGCPWLDPSQMPEEWSLEQQMRGVLVMRHQVTPDKILALKARQVLDSRGNPTVEVEVHCQNAVVGRAIVPSGASTGRHEAVELRDGDAARYGGKSVSKAIANVRETIGPKVMGLCASHQDTVDRLMVQLDGTPDKSRLGANAILGVSLACAHAAAATRKLPLWKHLADEAAAGGLPKPALPLPMVNMISGGLHAGRNLDVQDFLLVPVGARSYAEALHMSALVHDALSRLLIEQGHEGVLIADEGGFGPKLKSNEEAVALLVRAMEKAGFKPGTDAAIGIDVAATHFFADGSYRVGGKSLSAADLVALLAGWVERYPIVSIEDGMAEDDWQGWKLLTHALGQRVQLIGDDLFVTHPRRLQEGIEQGVANAILIKVNQIGTLTETLAVLAQARQAGYRTIISARSGETEDTTIADLAVATGAGQIKIGSVARSERLAKYNQLLRIEEEGLPFAKWTPIPP